MFYTLVRHDMHPSHRYRLAIAIILCALIIPTASAAPIRDIVGEVMDRFFGHAFNETILDSAKSLFWSLATISLVWTMGMMIVRQDIGEILMELLRFIVVTGIFYWLLVNASVHQGGQGFVDAIVRSFLQMPNDDPSDTLLRYNANSVFATGQLVFLEVIRDTGEAKLPDQLIAGAMAVTVLSVCAIISAQFLLVLIMAWMLGYAGIFLLGFGGARWTSPIAVNFYKHVVAVGAALLSISIIGSIGAVYLKDLKVDTDGSALSAFQFDYLSLMLGVSILMVVLSIKVPQMLYSMITGSALGFYAGTASAAGAAIANAGTSAYAAASGRLTSTSSGSGGGGPPGGSDGAAPNRVSSVMDAVQRSASVAGGMADPFHVGAGADPFGVARVPDPRRGARGGSVFGGVQIGAASVESTVTSASVDESISGNGRVDGGNSQHVVRSAGESGAARRDDVVSSVEDSSWFNASPMDVISIDGDVAPGEGDPRTKVHHGVDSDADVGGAASLADTDHLPRYSSNRIDIPRFDEHILDGNLDASHTDVRHRVVSDDLSISEIEDSQDYPYVGGAGSVASKFGLTLAERASAGASPVDREWPHNAGPVTEGAHVPHLSDPSGGADEDTMREGELRRVPSAASLSIENKVPVGDKQVMYDDTADALDSHQRSGSTASTGDQSHHSKIGGATSEIEASMNNLDVQVPSGELFVERRSSAIAGPLGAQNEAETIVKAQQRMAPDASSISTPTENPATASVDRPVGLPSRGGVETQSPSVSNLQEDVKPSLSAEEGVEALHGVISISAIPVSKDVSGLESGAVASDHTSTEQASTITSPIDRDGRDETTPAAYGVDMPHGSEQTSNQDHEDISKKALRRARSSASPDAQSHHPGIGNATSKDPVSASALGKREPSGELPNDGRSSAIADSVGARNEVEKVNRTQQHMAQNGINASAPEGHRAEASKGTWTGAQSNGTVDTSLRSASVAQEDMPPATPTEENAEVLRDAVSPSAAPDLKASGGGMATKQADEPDPARKPRRRRLRRYVNEPAQSLPPPMDTAPDSLEPMHDDKPPPEDPT